MLKEITIEFVRSEFEKEGYRLLSDRYVNAHQKLYYICLKGHKHSIQWSNWQQGRRCLYCGRNKGANKQRLNIDFIKLEFKKENYKLLTKAYDNAKQKLHCICNNEHEYFVNWSNWKIGKRCFTCKYIKQSGPGHPMWKGGISCEPYCFEWSFKEFKDLIKERDNYQCQNPDCWQTNNELCLHHIDYDKKNCDSWNLIILCRSCNARANIDRDRHTELYKEIMNKKYK